MAIKKYQHLILNTENIVIFWLFLLFAPIKIFFENSIYYFYDHLFISGKISSIFTYNYTGKLLGCEETILFNELNNSYNTFILNGIFFMIYIFSIIAAFFLFIRWMKQHRFSILDWILTLFICFSILNSFEFVYYFVSSQNPNTLLILHFIFSLGFITIGFFVFFKVFKKSQRLQTIYIGIPSFFLGAILWFKYIGNILLPI